MRQGKNGGKKPGRPEIDWEALEVVPVVKIGLLESVGQEITDIDEDDDAAYWRDCNALRPACGRGKLFA